MFKGLGNLASLMSQAYAMRGRMEQVAEDLKRQKVTGSAGGGMVEVEINGAHEMLRCQLDPRLMEQGDRELIEDLVVAATNQAMSKARELHAEAMKSVAGGLDLPPDLSGTLESMLGGKAPESPQ